MKHRMYIRGVSFLPQKNAEVRRKLSVNKPSESAKNFIQNILRPSAHVCGKLYSFNDRFRVYVEE